MSAPEDSPLDEHEQPQTVARLELDEEDEVCPFLCRARIQKRAKLSDLGSSNHGAGKEITPARERPTIPE